MKRIKRFVMRLSDEELAILKQSAGSLSIADYVRRKVFVTRSEYVLPKVITPTPQKRYSGWIYEGEGVDSKGPYRAVSNPADPKDVHYIYKNQPEWSDLDSVIEGSKI